MPQQRENKCVQSHCFIFPLSSPYNERIICRIRILCVSCKVFDAKSQLAPFVLIQSIWSATCDRIFARVVVEFSYHLARFLWSKSTVTNWMKTHPGMEWTVEADLLIVPNSSPFTSHWTIVFNWLKKLKGFRQALRHAFLQLNCKIYQWNLHLRDAMKDNKFVFLPNVITTVWSTIRVEVLSLEYKFVFNIIFCHIWPAAWCLCLRCIFCFLFISVF